VTVYLPVCAHQRQVPVDQTRPGETREARTQLFVIVSNWHFNRDAQKNPDEIECRTNDCTVGLKYSSTEFSRDPVAASADPTSYNWDKSGLSLSYPSFVALLSDKYFTNTFMSDVRRQYEEKQGVLLGQEDLSAPEDLQASETSGSASAATAPAAAGSTKPPSGIPAKKAAPKNSNAKKKPPTGSKRAKFPEEYEEDEIEAVAAALRGEAEGEDDDDESEGEFGEPLVSAGKSASRGGKRKPT